MRRIPVKSRSGIVGYALVDDDDYERLAGFSWHRNSWGYVRRGEKQDHGVVAFSMAREVLGVDSAELRQVDHVNGDKMDNRRCNLRLVTPAQNMQNRPSTANAASRFRGVTVDRSNATKPWRARVRIAGKLHELGRFADEIAAARSAERFRQEHMPFANPDPALLALNTGDATP